MTTDNLGDWRIEFITTIEQDVSPTMAGGTQFRSGDRAYVSTLTKTSKGDLIAFTTPNVSALAYNIAVSSARRAIELKKQLSYISCLSPFGTARAIGFDQNDLIFSFFESSMTSVIFSFQVLEAFCNYSISHNWRQPVDITRRRKKERLDHESAERELSTEQKLKSVLPKIYNVPTPAGKSIWDRFIKLKHARDSCVHIKYFDQHPVGRKVDQESLFFRFLDTDTMFFPKTSLEIVAYFYSRQELPRWLREMPTET